MSPQASESVSRAAEVVSGLVAWWLQHADAVMGLALVLFAIAMLMWAHFGPGALDLSNILVDPVIGKMTPQSWWMFVAGCASTWVLVSIVVREKWDLVLGGMTIYLGAWGAVKVINDMTNKPSPPMTGRQVANEQKQSDDGDPR